MFFPATEEKVCTIEEIEGANLEKPNYMSHPTIIMCNPNALYYQHMVNNPNAFWLLFF